MTMKFGLLIISLFLAFNPVEASPVCKTCSQYMYPSSREECFKQNNGARELDRIISTHIKEEIADEILFGKLKHGGKAKVDLSKKEHRIIFEFTSIKQSSSTTLETN